MSQAFVINTFFDEEGSVENFLQLIDKATQHPETKALFVLAGDKNGFTSENISAHLQALQIPICGAIFPQIINQKQHYAKGTLICALSEPLDIYNVYNFVDYQENDEFLPDCPWLNQSQNIVVLIDVMSGNNEPFIERLYNHLGPSVPIVGGCAGSATFQPKPCIFSNDGLLSNVAQLIHFPAQLYIGVQHGWQPIAGPFLVTHAEGNKLFSLNYEPAFQVYRKVIEPLVNRSFDNEEFFAIAKEFPLGFDKENDELLARIPLFLEGETLVFPGGIPQNALTYILRGHVDKLIQAASGAIQEAIEQTTTQENKIALNFNCICRYLFLEEDFGKELAAIEAELPLNVPLCGALTLGEIVGSSKGGARLFNNTTVIGLLSTAV